MPRLYVDQIDSVGLVEAGDNPLAKVAFWKRKPTTSPERADDPQEAPMGDYDLTGLDDQVRENVEKDLARLAELETPDPIEEADPEVQAEFAKRDERIAELQKSLAAERDERLTVEYTDLAKTYPSLNDNDADKPAAVLKVLGEADRDALDWLLNKLEAVEKIVAESDLFLEIGSGDPGGSPSDQIEALAKEMQIANPDLTDQQARLLVRKARPDLKAAEREEVS